MRHIAPVIWFITGFLCIQSVWAASTEHAGHDRKSLPAGCEQQVKPDCASTVTPAFDDKGQLWVVFSLDQHAWVTRRGSDGKFLPAVMVNKVPESLYDDGENRPKMVVGPEGNLYVSWTQKAAERFSGNIRFSRSLDGGLHFSEPRTINDDGLVTSHRFDAMEVTPSGLLFLVWIDKRDKVQAEKNGLDYSGAAVYYTVSSDKGATFQSNRKVVDHSCECCRVAVAPGANDEVVVFWRQLFGLEQSIPIRDHAIATLAADKVTLAAARATRDEWALSACPHHGPDVSLDDDRITHLVWFTNSPGRKGIFYQRTALAAFAGPATTAEATSGEVVPVDVSPTASHPQILSSGKRVVIAWKRFDGKKTQLLWKYSVDGGRSWSTEIAAAETGRESDHPILVANGNRIHVSWLTRESGYQLIELAF